MHHQRGDTARGVENRGQGRQRGFAIWQMFFPCATKTMAQQQQAAILQTGLTARNARSYLFLFTQNGM